MVCARRDRPGVLAEIFSLLASRGVNVANCHLGRRVDNNDAKCNAAVTTRENSNAREVSMPSITQNGRSSVNTNASICADNAPGANGVEILESPSATEHTGLCICHTDHPIHDSLLEEIRKLEGVREAVVFATPWTLGQVVQ